MDPELIGCANKNMLFNIIIHVSLFKIPEIIPYSLLSPLNVRS
jgi:hypothetical protein